MRKFLLSAALLLTCAAGIPLRAAGPALKWNAANRFAGWHRPVGMTMKQENGLLILDITGKDSGMMNLSVDIAPADFGMLEVDYRATGLPKSNHGEFYYAGSANDFAEQRVWRLWNLDVSGQWTTLRIDGNRFPRGPVEECKRITKLRLDLTNEFPGRIEIREIRLLPPPAPLTVWNAANQFSGWHRPVGMTMKRENGLLILDITAKDSGMMNLSTKIPTAEYGALEVDYRATGLPERNQGEFYYATDKTDFSEQRVWRHWNLDVSGQWKTLRFEGRNFSPQAWKDCGTVTKLRLDLVNEFPGRIEIKEIRFMPFLPELADSQEIRKARKFPEVKCEIPANPPHVLDLGRPYYTGYMVKAQEDREPEIPAGGARFGFRREFTLEELPVKARIHIAGDDAYTCKLNGRHVSGAGSWYAPDIVDLEPGRFTVGKNVLTGIYWNHGGPGGVYFQIDLLMPDNTIRKIVSDENVELTPTGHNRDWTYPPADAVYRPAVLQTISPEGPWGRILPYKPLLPEGLSVTKNEFPAEVESGRRYDWKLEFFGVRCDPEDKITLRLESATGLEILEKRFKVGDVRSDDGKWNIPVETPKFVSSGPMRLKLLSSRVILPETVREFSYRNTRQKGPDYRARVRDGEVYLNGRRIMPILGHSAGKNENYQDMMFEYGGVELRGFTPRVDRAGSWWVGPGKYDFATVDARINKMLSLDENAGLIVYIPTTPPRWWARLYPDEIARYQDGKLLNDHEAKVSFASEKYREDAAAALDAFIEHMRKAPYSDRIAGYVVVGGYTSEWIQWYPFDYKNFSDYSEPARKRFAEYLKKEAPDLAPGIPTVAERRACEFGYFVHPQSNRRTLLYTRFMSDMIAECIEVLVRKVRQVAGEEKLIGVYYGYTMTCGNMGKLLNGSHGSLKRILDLEELDFFLCPMTYADRNLGDCGDDGMPFAAMRAAGKMPVVEDDIRTHLQGEPQPYYQTPDTWSTEQVIRRSLGRILSRNQMAEFYAGTTGTEFASKAVQNDFRTFRKAAKFIVDHEIKARPEIAVVVSARGFDYMAEFQKNSLVWHWEYAMGTGKPIFVPHLCKAITGEAVCFQRTALSKIGAPVDYLLAEDLGRVADRPYKLWIFLNQFDTTPELDAALKKIRSRSGTCLFLYAPGVFRNDRIDFANMERLTGIKLRVKEGSGMTRVTFPAKKTPETALLRYRGMGSENFLPLLFEAVSGRPLATYPDGKVGVAVTNVGRTKSIFCGVTKLSADFLRSLAADAGVWIYSDSEDVLFASDAFLTLHAATGGRKTLRFRRPVDVADVFTGEVLARNVKQFTFDVKMLETKVFYYGNDADAFVEAMKRDPAR